MEKYIIAPPAGSQTNALGAKDRPWEEVHAKRYPGINEYLAESTGYGIVSGCEPSISGLTVTVGAGVVHLADGTRKEISTSSITLDPADATNPRIDLVYIDANGVVAKVTGIATQAQKIAGTASYTITKNFKIGDTLTFCNQTIIATADTQDAAHFVLSDDINTTATNIVTALNDNSIINNIYTASVNNDSEIVITENDAGSGHTPGQMLVAGTAVLSRDINYFSAKTRNVPTLPNGGIKVAQIDVTNTGNTLYTQRQMKVVYNSTLPFYLNVSWDSNEDIRCWLNISYDGVNFARLGALPFSTRDPSFYYFDGVFYFCYGTRNDDITFTIYQTSDFINWEHHDYRVHAGLSQYPKHWAADIFIDDDGRGFVFFSLQGADDVNNFRTYVSKCDNIKTQQWSQAEFVTLNGYRGTGEIDAAVRKAKNGRYFLACKGENNLTRLYTTEDKSLLTWEYIDTSPIAEAEVIGEAYSLIPHQDSVSLYLDAWFWPKGIGTTNTYLYTPYDSDFSTFGTKLVKSHYHMRHGTFNLIDDACAKDIIIKRYGIKAIDDNVNVDNVADIKILSGSLSEYAPRGEFVHYISGNLTIDNMRNVFHTKSVIFKFGAKATLTVKATNGKNISYSIVKGKNESVEFISDGFSALMPKEELTSSARVNNTLYRGMDITAYFDSGEMSKDIANVDFSNIYIGDYINKPITVDGTTYNVKWLVADIDYFYNINYHNKHGVVMICETVIPYVAKMKNSGSTDGGYLSSDMWISVIPKFTTALQNAFGTTHIQSHKEYLSDTVNNTLPSMMEPQSTGTVTNCVWTDVLANIPSSRMCGVQLASSWKDGSDNLRPLSLFRVSPAFSDDHKWYFTRTVARDGSYVRVEGLGSYFVGSASYIDDHNGQRIYFVLQ